MDFISNLTNTIKVFSSSQILELNQLALPKEITALIFQTLPIGDHLRYRAVSKDLLKISKEFYPEVSLINAAMSYIRSCVLQQTPCVPYQRLDKAGKLTAGGFFLKPLKCDNLVGYRALGDNWNLELIKGMSISDKLVTMTNLLFSQHSSYLHLLDALLSSDFIQIDFQLNNTQIPTLVCKRPITDEIKAEIQEKIDTVLNFNEDSKNHLVNTHFPLII